GADKTVTIASLTITNGNYVGGSGGGIYNYQATLTMSNCTLSGNSAQNGGAIYNNNAGGHGTLAVTASTLSGNSARYGGGIYNDAVSGSAGLGLTASAFRGNSALFGGGIYNNGRGSGNAFVGMTGCTFSGN